MFVIPVGSLINIVLKTSIKLYLLILSSIQDSQPSIYSLGSKRTESKDRG